MKNELAMAKRLEGFEKGMILTPNVWKIQKIYKEVVKQYPNAVIAGGSIVDCVYNKTFFDVDIFVYGADIDPIKYPPVAARNGLLTVEVMHIDNEKLDIIILNKPFVQHIKTFDLNIKRCYYDGNFHFTKEAKKDFIENTLRIGCKTGDSTYFRYLRTIEKYGLEINKDSFYPFYNYLSWKVKEKKTIYVTQKYQKDKKKFKPAKRIFVKQALDMNKEITEHLFGN